MKPPGAPELAREYLLTQGTNYSFEDLLVIAQGQLALEDEYAATLGRASKPLLEKGRHIPLIIDTDMHVMKVWCDFVFGQCHEFILEQIQSRKYDLYLLCNVDLPWTKDELREYPDLATRQQLYTIYKNIMINQSVPWVDISGAYEQRFKKAVAAIDPLL